MELKIFEEDKEDKTKPPVCLRLVEGYEGIILIACDEDGGERNLGNLLKISKNGKIYLCQKVNKNLGFQLDSNGRIEVEKI